MELPDIEEQLEVGVDPVSGAADRALIAGILEALNHLRLEQHRQVVAPAGVGHRHALAVRRLEQDLVDVESHQRGRLGHHQQPVRHMLGRRRKTAAGDQIVDRDLARAGAAAGHALQSGQNAVDLVGVARQGAGEGVDIGDGAVQRVRVLRQDVIDMLEGVARGLGPVLPGLRLGDQGRGRAVFAAHHRRGRGAAFQGHRGAAGQPLSLDADHRVAADRGAALDGDHGGHVLGRIGSEPELGHFADAKAVEHHRRTDQQSRDRALELDQVGFALRKAAFVLEPIDKAEARGDHGEHEQSDQGVAGARFHRSGSSQTLTTRRSTSMPPRLPWK